MGSSNNRGTPIAGWFISWTILFCWWFGVTPVLGNLHILKYTHNYILYTATYIFIYSTVYTIPIGSPYGIFTLHVWSFIGQCWCMYEFIYICIYIHTPCFFQTSKFGHDSRHHLEVFQCTKWITSVIRARYPKTRSLAHHGYSHKSSSTAAPSNMLGYCHSYSPHEIAYH